MLIGFYGLNSNESSLKFVYPERIFSNNELKNLNINYSDFSKTDEKIDHITCHADGTFHIKTKDTGQVYRDVIKRTEPLGPDTSVFLEMIIITDLVKNYEKTAEIPKYPHVWTDGNDNEFFLMECVFSGSNYQLEEYISGRLAATKRNLLPCLSVGSSTIRGFICPTKINLPSELLKKKPNGTIILLKFPTTDDHYRIKGFIFA
jgi:hypothetical protein